MRPIAPRPPRPAGSPSSSASSGSNGSVHREREHSPFTSLPPPATMPVIGPMHPPPHAPMMDARRYRNLFSRRRVAPPTPLPSDDEPSYEGDDALSSLKKDENRLLSRKPRLGASHSTPRRLELLKQQQLPPIHA
ncbi:hypothetical protein PIB30_087945 [Stylosanthes scabra]|uniref:Uncharacterized protein n=1 Tax=Stylosanthes scabra TaxID=79078 RepID=A0ABU6RTH0_9FABA|nr:hypothetical protein [Stylosanthes scabra]